jgi:hypothetical protein
VGANQKILTVNGEDFTVRWRGMIDRPTFHGIKTMGWCYTGTINQYRLPHLHESVERLLFCAWQIATNNAEHPQWMFNNLGKPDDIEAFLA